MAKSRDYLSAKFHELCNNVYFQPPTGTKLKYPCILYSFENVDKKNADNRGYIIHTKYSVTYITRDPDDMIKFELIRLPLSALDRTQTVDNLYHYYFTIYN